MFQFMSDIPLQKLRRKKDRASTFGIALTPSTGSATMHATVPASARRERGQYDRYSDDVEEEQGLLEGEGYHRPETVRAASLLRVLTHNISIACKGATQNSYF